MLWYLSILLVALGVECASLPKTIGAKPSYKSRRQIFAWATDAAGKGGKLKAAPPGSVRLREDLPAKDGIPNAKRVKMRYGPYNVIGMEKTSMLGEEGALWNYPDTEVPKPAEDFTIFGWQAGLEYTNGTDANIDSGMWLHHMVHFNVGQGREDATCAGTLSMPHFDVQTLPGSSERMFSSGNERTYVDLSTNSPDGKVDMGYHVVKDDRWAFIVDLMNMNMEDRVVFLTLTFDYFDGFPAGFDQVKPLWFDVNQCGTSELSPLAEKGSYTIESQPWKPNFEGEIVALVTHVHDGAVTLDIFSKPDRLVCGTTATYGANDKYLLPQRLRMGPEQWAVAHISNMSQCTGEDMRRRKVDQIRMAQNWFIRAKYDYDVHAGNANSFGVQEEIMAIALLYVRVPREGVVIDRMSGATAANPSISATAKGVFYNIMSNMGLAKLFGTGPPSHAAGGSESPISAGSMPSMAGMAMR